MQVIIDQWDTGPGDDLPKFMEKSIGEADRVLVICSDPYVTKADDGRGGAGYEAMIVTGELAKDLMMNKFIPIIRQPHGNAKKPRFLEPKYHIDFNDDAAFDIRLEELLREIHKAPKHVKPPLGKNPFEAEAQAYEQRGASPSFRLDLSMSLQLPDNASEAYNNAFRLIRADDRIGWRKLLQKAVSAIGKNLLEWRTSSGQQLPDKVDDLPQWALPAVTSVSPTMAIALAGVESATDYYANQVGLVDEFIRPAGWEVSGNTVLVQIPELIVFVYQALLGGLAMQTQQAEISMRLARLEIPSFYSSRQSTPLFLTTGVTGWPESLNHTVTIAWAFLMQLQEKWPWIHEVFGDADFYKGAICSYYAVLNLIEFMDALERNVDLSNPATVMLTVPVSFAVTGEKASRRALRILENNRAAISAIWRKPNVDRENKQKKWDQWKATMGTWLGSVYSGRAWRYEPFHSDFIAKLP